MVNDAPQYKLGPLPWGNEQLEAKVWSDGPTVQEWVKEHPGFEFEERLESLQAMLRIFESSGSRFQEQLKRFHMETAEGGLLRRNRRHDLAALKEQVQELLYLFTSSAMTLVDQSRALSKKVALPGYEERKNKDFVGDPQHRFIQELRVDLVHVALHQPSWQITSGRDEERESKFMIHAKGLRRAPSYNKHAKSFLIQNPKGIDLGHLVESYTQKVLSFHAWFRDQVESVVGDQMDDYRRCCRCVRAVSSRCWWNILLKQVVIAGARDPYDYLGEYLTDEEMREVCSMPSRSRAQIDRIVELVDEEGACNEELRKVVYEAFGAVDA